MLHVLLFYVFLTTVVATTVPATTTTVPECEAFVQPPSYSTCSKPKWSKAGVTLTEKGPNNMETMRGIFIDPYDNLYVTDYGGARIAKLANDSKVFTRAAGISGYFSHGNNSDQLYYPEDVTVDIDGNMFISDTMNRRIQKWALNSTQGITVKKGTPNSADIGIFINGKGDLYTADYISGIGGRIMKYSLKSGSESVIATGFQSPQGIFVDKCDHVYIVDLMQHTVQKVTSGSSMAVTVAGVRGQSGSYWNYLNSPRDVILDQYGNLYIADTLNHRIQRMSAKYGSFDTVAGETGQPLTWATHLSHPVSLTFDSKWNLYVADNGNRRVQKFLFESGDLYC